MNDSKNKQDIKSTLQLALQQVSQDYTKYKNLPNKLRKNTEVITEAIRSDFLSVRHVHEELLEVSPFLRTWKEASGNYEIALEWCNREYGLLHQDSQVKELHWIELASSFLKQRDPFEMTSPKVNWFGGFGGVACGGTTPSIQFRKSEFSAVNEENDLLQTRKILCNKKFRDLKIQRLLGRGAYGGTYLCQIIGINGLYAVKIYNNNDSETKLNEQLKKDGLMIPYHENIADVLLQKNQEIIELEKLPDFEDYWKNRTLRKVISNSGILLMKYHRRTLKSFFENWNMFNNPNVSYIGSDSDYHRIYHLFHGIIKGICHLQKNYIVHRDIHEENVFVDHDNGRVWIGDFGCSLDLRLNNLDDENIPSFKVKKEDDIMFSFTSPSYWNNNNNSTSSFSPSEFFKKGGCGLSPEIRNFDPIKEEELNYQKCDVFSVGVLGRRFIEKNTRIECFNENIICKENGKIAHSKFGVLLDYMTKEDIDERFSCFESNKEMENILDTLYK